MSELTSKLIKVVQEVMSHEVMTAEEKTMALQVNLLGQNIGQGNHLDELISKMEAYGVVVPTGYPLLDELLDGGFRTGVSLIPAPPGTGKTTFALQMAEGFSARGVQTVYISNDMAKEELVAKMISRHSYHIAKNNGYSADQILRHLEDLKNTALFQQSLGRFRELAEYLQIIDDETGTNLTDLLTLISHYGVYGTGTDAIVIFIDYIQNINVLGDHGEKLNDKEQMDKVINALRTVAKTHKLVIIGISSTNRTSYTEELSLQALKESGGLEFGADLVLGLQYQGVGDKKFNLKAAQRKTIRSMELVVLKHRMGSAGNSLAIKYNPKYNIIPFDEMTF
jgi:replicative DNA helicase